MTQPMYVCAAQGMGYRHPWTLDVAAPPEWVPGTDMFVVEGRRYDVCDADRGGCGMYRCYLIGADRYVARYQEATRVRYDDRPDPWMVHAMVERAKHQARLDEQRRRRKTTKKKPPRKLRVA